MMIKDDTKTCSLVASSLDEITFWQRWHLEQPSSINFRPVNNQFQSIIFTFYRFVEHRQLL